MLISGHCRAAIEVANSNSSRAIEGVHSVYCRAAVEVANSISSRAVEIVRSISCRAIEVARSVSSRTVEGAHSIYYSAAVEAANSIAPPPARPSSHRTVVRSASCAIEALKLHFNCAVVRSSFIAPSSAHASLRMASYLLSACHISPFDFVSSSVSMSACFSMSLSQNHLTHQ